MIEDKNSEAGVDEGDMLRFINEVVARCTRGIPVEPGALPPLALQAAAELKRILLLLDDQGR